MTQKRWHTLDHSRVEYGPLHSVGQYHWWDSVFCLVLGSRLCFGLKPHYNRLSPKGKWYPVTFQLMYPTWKSQRSWTLCLKCWCALLSLCKRLENSVLIGDLADQKLLHCLLGIIELYFYVMLNNTKIWGSQNTNSLNHSTFYIIKSARTLRCTFLVRELRAVLFLSSSIVVDRKCNVKKPF